MDNIVIAVDGPAGAGKSTISKIVAARLNINYIDTGAMYRALTYNCLRKKVDTLDEEAVVSACEGIDVDFNDNKIYIDGECVDSFIRSVEVTSNVSNVAKIKRIRELMVNKQREIGAKNNVILDGRDVGTCIFPDTKNKFFLVASPQERGRRRYEEMIQKGEEADLETVIEDIKKRDLIDSTREVSPLVKASDAIEVDTTNIDIEDVVDFIISHIK